MAHGRYLAVHDALRAHHLAAKHLPDRLVPQTDTENGHPPGQAFDQFERDAGALGRARPGGDDNGARRERLHLVDADLVVADHAHLGAELGEVLHQVVGERVVVVDHQHHGRTYAVSLAATAAARRSARALCCVSCHSDCGSESATTPAAACTCSRRSLITAVRIAIATSMSPLKPR